MSKGSLQKWADYWVQITTELEKLRRKDLPKTNTEKSLRLFQSSFRAALKTHPPRQTSGLVEQQKYFSKFRT